VETWPTPGPTALPCSAHSEEIPGGIEPAIGGDLKSAADSTVTPAVAPVAPVLSRHGATRAAASTATGATAATAATAAARPSGAAAVAAAQPSARTRVSAAAASAAHIAWIAILPGDTAKPTVTSKAALPAPAAGAVGTASASGARRTAVGGETANARRAA